MNAPLTTETLPWSADVVAFAASNQVQPCLAPLVEITRRLFPLASWVKVYLADDPETSGDRHILFDVQVGGMELEQVRTARTEWNRELLRCCPAPRAYLFRLLLDLQN
jgi:hypothetical protein